MGHSQLSDIGHYHFFNLTCDMGNLHQEPHQAHYLLPPGRESAFRAVLPTTTGKVLPVAGIPGGPTANKEA